MSRPVVSDDLLAAIAPLLPPRIRYERRADIHEAFTLLGCALICLNQIRRLCQAL
jgi:hypothetical protein